MKSPKKITVTRRTLAARIATLSSAQQQEILNIVRQHNVSFSRNQNGCFFDVDDVPPACLKQIHDFVSYSLSNQETLDAYDRHLQLCKQARVPVSGGSADSNDDPSDHQLPSADAHNGNTHRGRCHNVKKSFEETSLLFSDAYAQQDVSHVIQYLYNRTQRTDQQSDSDAQNNIYEQKTFHNAHINKPAVSTTIKFMNYKKKFGKPPRTKAYDPDDTSFLATFDNVTPWHPPTLKYWRSF